MKTYLSTGAFRTRDLGEIIQICSVLNIKDLELSSGVKHEPNLHPLIDTMREAKFRLLIHNYFPAPAEPFALNLASDDPETLERSRAHCRQGIDLSLEVGATFYSVHSGFAIRLSPGLLGKPEAQAQLSRDAYISREEAYKTFLESVSDLADYAESRGMRFLLENNVVAPSYMAKHKENPLLMTSPQEIVGTLNDLSHPQLGLLVDVGHAKVSGCALGFSMEEFIESVAPYVEAFHLSDNDGQKDQNRPFDETAWFCPVLRDFSNLPCVIEVYSLSPDEIEKQVGILETVLS